MVGQASGVGPKLAARITNELKDKMGLLAPSALRPGGAGGLAVLSGAAGEGEGGGEGADAVSADAVSALVNLGYRRTEAFGAVAQARSRLGREEGREESVEALIPAALKELAS